MQCSLSPTRGDGEHCVTPVRAVALENSRHFAAPPTVSRRLRNERRRNSILMTCPYSDLGSACDWLKQIFNQSHASSVWNFCARFSVEIISQGNQWWWRKMSAGFSFYPSGYKEDYLHTKRLVFFSLFLTHSFFLSFSFSFSFFMRLNGKVKYFRWDALSWYFVLQATPAYIIQVVIMDNSKSPSFLL